MSALALASFAFANSNRTLEGQAKVVMLNVNSAYVPDNNKSADESYVVVSGTFNNGCYRWSHSTVKDPDQKQVIEVRNYATVDQGNCIMVLIPYQNKVVLGKLARGEYQVRIMNGDGTFFDRPLTVN